MTSFRNGALVLLAAAITPMAVSCSTNDGTAQPSANSGQATSTTNTQPARPTLTDPKLQPPPQDNQHTASTNRPKIVFDPCTWISNETVNKAGFDGASRKRDDDLIAEYSFLTCSFPSPKSLPKGTLSVDSGNATWEEDLAKVGSYSEPTTINGREALIVHDQGLSGDCQVDLRTKVGFVQVTVSPTYPAPRDPDPCKTLLGIATTIEPEIGKDN